MASDQHVVVTLKGSAEAETNNSDDGKPKQTSTWLDTSYHNITAMVGAGVLGLPATFATLGWAGGLIVLIASLGISWFTFGLLVHLHEGGPNTRYNRYHELCQFAYGKQRGVWAILSFQIPFLYGLAVTYTVTGGLNLGSFAALVQTGGVENSANYIMPQAYWIIIFSAVEILVAQMPDLGSLGWVSGVGAVMSVTYSLGGSVLSLKSAVPRSEVSYDPGQSESTKPQVGQVLDIFSAITTIFFAFGGHNIALEIQSILPHPPSTVTPMMKGVHVAFVLTIICYLTVSVTGFYSFGSLVQDNILLSAGPNPLWLLAACHLAVVLHVTASYQVYSFPLFDLLELWLARVAAPAAAQAGGHPAPGAATAAHPDEKLESAATARSTSISVAATRHRSKIGSGVFARSSKALDGASADLAGPEGGLAPFISDQQDSATWEKPAGSAADGGPAGSTAHTGCGGGGGGGGGDASALAAASAATPPAGFASHVLYAMGPWARRLMIRLSYIVSTCFIACLVPFFGDLMGLIGAVGATPTTFVMPCLLWLTIKRPPAWVSWEWWTCWVIAITASCIGILGAMGAMYNIIQDSQTYEIFGG